MTAPALVPVDASTLPASTPRDVPLGAAWFRVVRGGVADRRLLRAGDLVVVGGRAGIGDAVVLVPTGRGQARMGRVGRDGLRGDAGEPCDPVRWSAAGRVVRVIAGPRPRDEGPPPVAVFRGFPLRAAQLALFSA